MSPFAAKSVTFFSESPATRPFRKKNAENTTKETLLDGRGAEHPLIPPVHSPLALQENTNVLLPITSPNALLGAYWRLSTEDRIRRASRITTPIIALRNTGEDLPGSSQAQPTCSSIAQGTSRHRTLAQSENNIETLAFTPPSPVGGGDPFISDNSNSSRYKLRPNRASIFPPRKPEYLVDRRRFPHFFKYSLNLQGVPDSDSTPPSRTPTPIHQIETFPLSQVFPVPHQALNSLAWRCALLSHQIVNRPEFVSSEEQSLPT